jgi:hypothetical protein
MRYSLLLPLFSVMVWGKLVAGPILLSLLRLLISNGQVRGGLHGHRLIPAHDLIPMAVRIGTYPIRDLVQALNLPGIVIELLTSLPFTFPTSWYPVALDLFEWRAIVYPFFCLPFWWFAGLGIDGLMRQRILRWFALLPGTLVAGFFFILAMAGMFGETADFKSDSKFAALLLGALFWSLLFAAFPASWIRNRRYKVVE